MIHKSHTKSDLIHIVNNINLNIRISHGDSKKQIHDKFIDYYDSTKDLIFKKNLYDIKDLRELKLFLSKPIPFFNFFYFIPADSISTITHFVKLTRACLVYSLIFH